VVHITEDVPLRELLEALLGPEGRRRLTLRTKTNEGLLAFYDNELVFRNHNQRQLETERRLVRKFLLEYLGAYPPSPELAKGFLAQYVNKKPRTLARYAATIKGLMKWYGEPMDDFRIKVPRSLPPYTENSDIEKLFSAIENKRSHKGCIVRDTLLVALALKSGMRRGELANLEPKDIHHDFLVVRNGKGEKDRVIPLAPAIALRLLNFIKGMTPTEKVFKLKAPCISMKIKHFARKAGLESLHTHTLRHKYATDLLEAGADIRTLQELMGHADLSTTQIYLSITDKRLREAANLLEDKPQTESEDVVTLKVRVPKIQRTPQEEAELRAAEEKLWPELKSHGPYVKWMSVVPPT
jgi:integrase/recombinase XerD